LEKRKNVKTEAE